MGEDNRLMDILLRWEERFENGRDVPAEELCRDCPELAGVVAERIADLKSVAWVNTDTADPALEQAGVARPAAASPAVVGGRYRLDALIGEGGFGEVWRAFDLELRRFVAVKVPKQGRFVGPERIEGLLAEARKAASLKHPGIVTVHDVVRHEDACIIVSDLIDGVDLGERVRAGRLPVREAVQIVAAVADALDYAHNQGVIHRDIKPANILTDRNGQVYLTDFGIAVTGDESHDHPAQVCGTPPYMAPEQRTGRPGTLDGRSDIYSLGVVLFELLTGVRPHLATTTVKLRGGAGGDASAWPPSNRLMPPPLDSVCQKCLATNPADRYPAARDMADELRKATVGLMTENEWRACTDPMQRLGRLYKRSTPRKMRLFYCACVRQTFPVLEDERSARAVEAAERYTDGQVGDAELASAWDAAYEAVWQDRAGRRGPSSFPARPDAAYEPVRQNRAAYQRLAAAWSISREIWTGAVLKASSQMEADLQCRLMDELFGPFLFRPIVLDLSLFAWDGGRIPKLAQAIYDGGEYDRMSRLADVLQLAACDNEEILAHCRNGLVHVRGCWVIDLLIGKA